MARRQNFEKKELKDLWLNLEPDKNFSVATSRDNFFEPPNIQYNTIYIDVLM